MLESGQIVIHGKYRVGKRIGAGGMGEVYEAIDLTLQRPVALKAVRPRPDESGRSRVTHRELDEARIAAKLTHQNIVHVIDAEIEQLAGRNEILVIVMELVRGPTLSARLNGEGWQWLPTTEAALQLARQILDGMLLAHDDAVIHRDLKPTNIMLKEQPQAPGKAQVVIMDFGLAVSLRDRQYEGSGGPARGRSLYGSAVYMPPEQLHLWARHERRVAQFADDVHALGVILWQILARSFDEHPLYVIEGREVLSWRELNEADLPIVLRCLRKGPAHYLELTDAQIPEPFLRDACNGLIKKCLGLAGERPSNARVLLEEFQSIQGAFERQQRSQRDDAVRRQGEAYARHEAQRQMTLFEQRLALQRAAERRRDHRLFATVIAGAGLAVSLSLGISAYRESQTEQRNRERAIGQLVQVGQLGPACGSKEAAALLDIGKVDAQGVPQRAVLIPARNLQQVLLVDCVDDKIITRFGPRQIATAAGPDPAHGLYVRLSPANNTLLAMDGTTEMGHARLISSSGLDMQGVSRHSIEETAFSADGSVVLVRAFNSKDPTVILSGPDLLAPRIELPLRRISAAALSADGKLVVAGNEEGRLALWWRDGDHLQSLSPEPLIIPPPSDRVKHLVISPDRRWLAVAFGGKSVWIYPLPELGSADSTLPIEMLPPYLLKSAGSPARALSFTDDGMLLVGTDDQLVRGFRLTASGEDERLTLRVGMTPKRVELRDGLLVAADHAKLTLAAVGGATPPLDLVVQDARWQALPSGGFVIFGKRPGDHSPVRRFVFKSAGQLAELRKAAVESDHELAALLLPAPDPSWNLWGWLYLSARCSFRQPGSSGSLYDRLSRPLCERLRLRLPETLHAP